MHNNSPKYLLPSFQIVQHNSITVRDMETNPESPLKQKNSPRGTFETSIEYTRLKNLIMKTDKTFKEAHHIYELLKDFDLFAEVQELGQTIQSTFVKVCKKMEIKKFEQGTVLYHEGEASDGKIYIVLSGEVALENKIASTLCKDKIKTFFDTLLARNEPKREHQRTKSFAYLPVASHGPDAIKNQPLDQEKLLVKLAESNSLCPVIFKKSRLPGKKMNLYEQAETARKDIKCYGSYFGHDFSFPANTHRNEEAVAYTDCELIILSSELLAPIRAGFQKRAEENFNFLISNFPGLFELESFEEITMMTSLFEPIKLTRGQTLTNEGEAGSTFFLIKDGDFEVYKKARSEVGSYHFHDSLAFLDKCKIYKSYAEDLKICYWTTGTFIGEEILYQEPLKYEYTVKVASSEAVVYAVDRVKFAFRSEEFAFMKLRELYETKMAKNSALFKEKLKYLAEYFNMSSPRAVSKYTEKGILSPRNPNQRNLTGGFVPRESPTIFSLAQALKKYVHKEESPASSPRKIIKSPTKGKKIIDCNNFNTLHEETEGHEDLRRTHTMEFAKYSKQEANLFKMKSVDGDFRDEKPLNLLSRKNSQPSLADILEQDEENHPKMPMVLEELKPKAKAWSMPEFNPQQGNGHELPNIMSPVKISGPSKLKDYINIRALKYSGSNVKRFSLNPKISPRKAKVF